MEYKHNKQALRYIVVDLEATCWENVRDYDRMETIEIGAVELPAANLPPTREFSQFIRPVVEPQLSKFCRQLTSIKQRDIDEADEFWLVFPKFLEWIGNEPFVFCSWGAYDQTQFRIDCERHSLEFPPALERHLNLKKAFAEVMNVKSCGMERALAHAGFRLEGTHHRGIDDARNIAKLAALILPVLEASDVETTHA